MDLDDFRSILADSGVGIWGLIETAITVASLDYGTELRDRRDGIIGKLYAEVLPMCRNCDSDRPRPATNGSAARVRENDNPARGERRPTSPVHDLNRESPLTPPAPPVNDEDADEEDREVDDEKRRILAIKDQIESHQDEETLVELLQSLADMEITFRALEETDIGRHVNRLRKHSSNDVRRLVKLLVRKWKDLVEEWVRLNPPGKLQSSALIADGDSPLLNLSRNQQNGHHNQVPDFTYSPNLHNGISSSEKSNTEFEMKPKTAPPRRDPSAKLASNASISAPPPNRQRDPAMDAERLASARKRLQENYQEASNAKKQRTVQALDIHEIPKPKNAFFSKNRGGFHGRH